jgi:hypothetical protein
VGVPDIRQHNPEKTLMRFRATAGAAVRRAPHCLGARPLPVLGPNQDAHLRRVTTGARMWGNLDKGCPSSNSTLLF